MELVTVCITTFNRSGLIEKTLKSILNQTYEKLEILIIDDCSQDNTQEFIEKNILLLDKRIKYIRKDKNEGLSAARNTAIFCASGNYIVFCDDDDELTSSSIFERMELMKSKENSVDDLAIVYSGCSIEDQALNKVYYQKPLIKGLIADSIKKGVLTTVPSTSLCSVRLMKKMGGFDENLKSFVDHDFWLIMSESGYSACFIDKPLTKTVFYKSKKSMVTDVAKRIEYIEVFLTKWDDYLSALMSLHDKKEFLNSYRLRVIGSLSVLMLLNIKLNNFLNSYNYLVRKVGIFKATFFIIKSTGKSILRNIYYKFVKIFSKKNCVI